jgi:hypothetical protein
MRTSFELTDEKGYSQRQEEIDALILQLLSDGGKTAQEIYTALREVGVGNAESDDRYELSYSSTGSIGRSACNSLRRRRLIYDTWDVAQKNGGKPEPPFRYFKA